MDLMKNIFKKIVPGMILFSLLIIAGIFFGVSNASASDMRSSTMECSSDVLTIQDAHCILDNHSVQKNSPSDNTFMPCCLERHDNSETALPSALQDRIKFSEQALIGEADTTLIAAVQKTYLSSKSPPKKADILSSVRLKE